MAKVTTRSELADHALRALGAPVIEINVDQDQIEDRIDDAIQYYQEYHVDAVLRNYRKHQLTQADIDSSTIDTPDSVLNVMRILDFGNSNINLEFNVEYQMRLHDIMTWGASGNIQLYDQRMQHLSLIDNRINGNELIRFSRHMNKLHIDEGFDGLAVGDWVVFETVETIDPTGYSDVYNDMFLKRYVTALIKRQWGANMSKFEGMQLPGGVTMNGLEIYNQANEEIMKIEEEMILNWSEPDNFLMG